MKKMRKKGGMCKRIRRRKGLDEREEEGRREKVKVKLIRKRKVRIMMGNGLVVFVCLFVAQTSCN